MVWIIIGAIVVFIVYKSTTGMNESQQQIVHKKSMLLKYSSLIKLLSARKDAKISKVTPLEVNITISADTTKNILVFQIIQLTNNVAVSFFAFTEDNLEFKLEWIFDENKDQEVMANTILRGVNLKFKEMFNNNSLNQGMLDKYSKLINNLREFPNCKIIKHDSSSVQISASVEDVPCIFFLNQISDDEIIVTLALYPSEVLLSREKDLIFYTKEDQDLMTLTIVEELIRLISEKAPTYNEEEEEEEEEEDFDDLPF